jgi:hypothetical protein
MKVVAGEIGVQTQVMDGKKIYALAIISRNWAVANPTVVSGTIFVPPAIFAHCESPLSG